MPPAAVLLGLYGYSWGRGPLATSDSAYYLAAARSWAGAGQLLNPDGSPYTFWAPLYPVLLAVVGAAATPARAVGLLHALALLVGWAGWTWLGRQLLRPANPGRWVLPWVLALSTPWLVAAKFVWAETGFLALFALYAVALYRYLEQRQVSWLLLATVAGILLPLQRSSGLFLLAGAAAGLTVGYGWRVWRPQRGALLLHVAASACAGVAWQVAVIRSGLSIPLVPNQEAAWGLQALSDFGFVLVRWLTPLPTPTKLVPLAYLLAGGALAVALSRGAAATGRFGRVLLLTSVVYIGWHVLANVLSRGAAGIHDGERYAGVLFGPVCILLSGALQLRSSTPLRHRMLVLALLLWLAYPVTRVLHNAVRLHKQPPATLLVPQTTRTSQKD
ncbi:hypothetical protein SAMN04487998_2275 [Hymenobacter actinosclerus]|uniref:Dolichyl-phosphate-mannose-protein mannosyltransferase n=1 Tax=Hymenobacter actinosclerus TaxID=82805 RepID=A0A1I0FHE6_9BACT|nr:hypothetical protein SAMN04487998_2275 [Hymenobacter actinosclerus]